MSRSRRVLAATLSLAPVLMAVSAAWADGPIDTIIESHPKPGVTVFEIVRPNNRQQRTAYPRIQLHPGDEFFITAGGCAQTGGSGRTWKTYVNPQGSSADHLYSGTVYIPGLIPLGADGGYARIGGWINKTMFVPANLPPTIRPDELILNLGYQDDDYSDNGYYAHDDGNYDQCKNVGDAHVGIRITAHPVAPAPTFTAWSRPFDLTWKTDAIDANGLPLNPFWAGQIDPAGSGKGDPATQLPDFPAACGGAFSWNYWHHGLDEDQGVLQAKCTSQSPTTDFDHSASVEPGPGSYCHPEPLSGHLDWLYATYTGTLFWQEYSGGWPNDGDVNFQLAPTGSSGLTDQNGEGIGLEFNASETIDNFTTPFWKQVHDRGEGDDNTGMAELVDRKLAIVTGLVGIDGVHGGYTEVHPVNAMAVCVSGCAVMDSDPGSKSTPIVYGADQTWAFFIQNYGSGGGCSSSEHFWPGLQDGTDPTKAWYFLSLPWHPGATAVSMTSSDVHASASLASAAPARWNGWTFVGFELPAPANGDGAEVDGQFTIHYTLAKPPPGRRMASLPTGVRGHPDEGGEFKDLMARVTDPTARARLTTLVQTTSPIRARPHPHLVRLTLGDDPRALKALASVTPERARQPVRDRPFIDAVRAQQKDAFFQQVVTIVPLRVRPGLIALPPAATAPSASPETARRLEVRPPLEALPPAPPKP